MILLESGDLASGGELLTERPGDGWTFLRIGDAAASLTVRFGGRGRKADVTYRVDVFRAVGAVGVRLVKVSPGTDPDDHTHDVLLPTVATAPPVCTCRGHARWRRCKHAAALVAVAERGLLDPTEPALGATA